jgi:hypothetical protein
MRPRDAKMLVTIARTLGPAMERAIAEAVRPLGERLAKLEAVANEAEASVGDIRKAFKKALAECEPIEPSRRKDATR